MMMSGVVILATAGIYLNMEKGPRVREGDKDGQNV